MKKRWTTQSLNRNPPTAVADNCNNTVSNSSSKGVSPLPSASSQSSSILLRPVPGECVLKQSKHDRHTRRNWLPFNRLCAVSERTTIGSILIAIIAVRRCRILTGARFEWTPAHYIRNWIDPFDKEHGAGAQCACPTRLTRGSAVPRTLLHAVLIARGHLPRFPGHGPACVSRANDPRLGGRHPP